MPRFVTNEAALAAGADLIFLCLDHADAAALEPPPGAVVVDLSGAHRLPDARRLRALVRLRPPAAGRARALELRAAGALAARRPPDREPRLLRDRRAARARAARATRSTPTASWSTRSRASPAPAARSRRPRTRGAVLENVAPYRVGRHQHAPEIEQALGFPVCFVPHLLPVRRGLIATCYVQPLAGRPARPARGGVR